MLLGAGVDGRSSENSDSGGRGVIFCAVLVGRLGELEEILAIGSYAYTARALRGRAFVLTTQV